jgi:hypothetical protein
MIWGSNPGGGEIFLTHPDRPWGPSSLIYNGYRVDHPPPYIAEVREREELYLYSPFGPHGMLYDEI